MPFKQLVEKRNELAAKQKKLADLFTEAGSDAGGNTRELDLDKITSIKGSRQEKLATIRKLNEELDAIGKEVDGLAVLEMAEKNLSAEHGVRGGDDAKVDRFPRDDNGDAKGIGELFADTAAFKGHQPGTSWTGLKTEIPNAADKLLKATFLTSSGWAPESIRTGRVVEEALRPIQVLDTIPGGRTGQAAVVYMEETTVTNAAAARAEEGAYAASTLILTEQTSTVRSIGTSLPVTDEQLADVPQAMSYLNMRLPFLVRQTLDNQLLNGSGAGVNLAGINNVSGIQTQALAGDDIPDAFYKAMVKVRVTGRAAPNICYIHPNDWQQVRLMRTNDGLYIWGNPSEAGPLRLWGVTVVETDVQAEGTGLVGDTMFAQLFLRQDVVVEIGYTNDDFTDGRQTLRAGVRAALATYRAAAFCQVTGI